MDKITKNIASSQDYNDILYYYEHIETNIDKIYEFYDMICKTQNNFDLYKISSRLFDIFIENYDTNKIKHIYNMNEKNDIMNSNDNGEKNDDIICVICQCTDNKKMINLKCDKKYNHCYCYDCFKQWYSKNDKKCVICLKNLCYENVIISSF